MHLSIEYLWDGTAREPFPAIYEDGHRVASFDTEREAIEWARKEYGDADAAGLAEYM